MKKCKIDPNEQPNLYKLACINKRISMLLEDPQTGHFTWHEALNDALTDIGEFVPKKEVA